MKSQARTQGGGGGGFEGVRTNPLFWLGIHTIRGGDDSLKVGVPVVLLFLLLHTNYTCGIIYVCVRRTDGPTRSARSRLRVVRGLQKWGGWAPPCKNLGGPEHPLPPLFLRP